MTIEAAKLDKGKRDALPEDDFAVPGKRKLPIHDAHHVKLAWDMVDRTGGLTSEEKGAARAHILRKAKSLGIDTKDWHKMQAMSLSAMSLNISTDDGHPNKLPFSGVLTRIGEPSDEAPHGSGGRRVTVTAAAAEKALSSLLGMAVNYQPTFTGHDPKAKIGIITSANIDGNAITVEGFLYAADFPEISERIQADKDVLGFSFEAQRIWVSDPASDPVEIVACEFTGAAILRKDKAAYQSTSISAEAETGVLNMSPDEMKALFAGALKEAIDPIATRLTAIEAGAKELDAKLEANKATMKRVEPHVTALESCCAAMEADGIGVADGGHVSRLRKMASSMRADAAMGKVPSTYSEYMYSAAAPIAAAAVDVAAEVAKAMAPLKAELETAKTKLVDMQASARALATAPERKTIPPAISALLAKAAITMPEGDTKLSVGSVDAALNAAGIPLDKRIQLKAELSRIGAL